jgi:hypothetical protein
MLLSAPRAPPIEEARKNLDQASKSLSSSAGNKADSVSRKTGETVEEAEQTIGGYACAAKDKAVGAWDATKQKAGELAGTAQDKKEEAKDRAGQTVDAQGVDLVGEFGANADELVEADGLLVLDALVVADNEGLGGAGGIERAKGFVTW